MQAAGYSRRLPNPDDRRSSLLELTPAGRSASAAAHSVVTETLAQRIGEKLSAREILLLASLLRALSGP